jgi:hypothetical protein
MLTNVQVAEALLEASNTGGNGSSTVPVTIAVEYSGSHTGAGLLFGDGFAVTCQQHNRARAWVPCVDAPSSRYKWDLQVATADQLTVVASGDLGGRSRAAMQKRTWHYTVAAHIAARDVVIALGDFERFVDARPAAALRAAVAESLAPAEDAAAPSAESLVLEGPVASVTGFARRGEASGLLKESCRAVRLVECLLEQWLLSPLPWPLFSIVFLPDWACQVRCMGLHAFSSVRRACHLTIVPAQSDRSLCTSA